MLVSENIMGQTTGESASASKARHRNGGIGCRSSPAAQQAGGKTFFIRSGVVIDRHDEIVGRQPHAQNINGFHWLPPSFAGHVSILFPGPHRHKHYLTIICFFGKKTLQQWNKKTRCSIALIRAEPRH